MIIGQKEFDVWNRTYVMGILNTTPDSFSDFLRRLLTIIDLRLHIMILDDRSRDQLWEK